MLQDPTKYKSDINIKDYRVEEENQRIILETNKGPLSVGLFDHLSIKIAVGESRAHR